MENNIEEDINKIKSFLEKVDTDYIEYNEKWIIPDIIKIAIENLLVDRERLAKENEIYKEEDNKISKALNFKEGVLNPDASTVIECMKKALKQTTAKANKYDSLIEKIKDKTKEIQEKLRDKSLNWQDYAKHLGVDEILKELLEENK